MNRIPNWLVFAILAFALGLFAWNRWSQVMTMNGAPSADGADPRDATYVIEGESVTLADGAMEGAVMPGSATRVRVSLFGTPVEGDLDGDGDADAAVVLVRDTGGSGTFYYAAIAVREAERYVGTEAVLLGDRIAPQTVELRDGEAIVNYVVRLPGEDFSVRPSQGRSMYLSIEPSTTRLVQRVPVSAAVAALRAKAWTWEGTYMNDGSATEPADPDAFTVRFGEDGTASFTTDCNAIVGSYEADDHLLQFGPLASTKMYCEGSQEQAFAAKLPEVQSYLISEGKLIMEIKYDSGTMVFH